jgi:hypothetical protein
MDLPERLQRRIYEWISVEGLTPAEVATMLSLKEAQVEEICARYEALPSRPQAVLLPPREMVRKEFELHDKRCAFLYQTAMSAWRASAEERSVQRRGKNGSVEFVTEVQRGQARYLSLAGRISRERTLAKVALAKLREEWALEDAAAGRTPEAIADDQQILAPIAPISVEAAREPILPEGLGSEPETPSEPPISVCAPQEPCGEDFSPPVEEGADVNTDLPATCDESRRAVSTPSWFESANSDPVRAAATPLGWQGVKNRLEKQPHRGSE